MSKARAGERLQYNYGVSHMAVVKIRQKEPLATLGQHG